MAKKPDSREDWFIRWISMSDLPTTSDVLAARQVIDPEETQTKVSATLKKLEKAGWLKSQKAGRDLAWLATKAGEAVMA